MNLVLIFSLLCLAELCQSTVMSASGEGLQSAVGEEPETEGGSSGLYTEPPLIRGRAGRRKHGGKKRNKLQVSVRQRISTPAQNLTYSPSHSPFHNSTYSSSRSSTHSSSQNPTNRSIHNLAPDPCSSSHREYCIHGYCTYIQDLREPVCVCMKGYDGVRCGIQLLLTGSGVQNQRTIDTLQISLITITVILSIISCSALLLIVCVHYRAEQRFMAFLSENDKLQNNGVV